MELIDQIKKGLIVSCQALEDEPLYDAEGKTMALMAKAAQSSGAVAIRANGVKDILAIKREVHLPIIGIIKKKYEGFEQHITVTMKEIDELVKVGCDIIALDCTMRPRPDGLSISQFIQRIKDKYPTQLLMADISTLEEAINAYQAGVDIVATTLNGYTPYTIGGNGPNFNLVEEMAKIIDIPIIAEGKIHYPEQAKKMLELGAYAIVVGGAITRPQEITSRFINAIES